MSPQSSSVSTALCRPMASCTARTSSATASLPSGATLSVSGSHLPKTVFVVRFVQADQIRLARPPALRV
jgi:hypothetical protein